MLKADNRYSSIQAISWLQRSPAWAKAQKQVGIKESSAKID